MRITSKKLVGLLPARNERHLLPQCLRTISLYTDAIVYLDDASEDDSLAAVESLARECRIEQVLRNTTWHRDEPADRNRLLQAGRAIGGTHFLVLDADELLTANCLHDDSMRRAILDLQPGETLGLTWIQLWRGTASYRFDQSVWTRNIKDFAFCDDEKARYEADFIHCPRTPTNMTGVKRRIEGYDRGVLHFQFVHWRNLLVKQAWYRCLERIRHPSKPAAEINLVYSASVDETGLGTRPSLAVWFADYPAFDPSVYWQPECARERQILGWFQHYGRDHFRDLDIWNIDWGAVARRPGLTGTEVSNPIRKLPRARHLRHSRPLVSAIVSTCNAERFMCGKLDDLQEQTVAAAMEIIVIDSGSDEDERSIVEAYQSQYDNIRYLRTEREIYPTSPRPPPKPKSRELQLDYSDSQLPFDEEQDLGASEAPSSP